MSSTISSSSSTQNQRFLYIEPNLLLRAISGYQNEPLVTLEEAIAPVKHLLGEDSDTDIYLVKKKSKHPKDGLTTDETAAVQLLTMAESENYKQSLYYILNQTLRSKDRQLLRIWYRYLKLLLCGLWKLPNEKKTIWRGANGNLSDQFSIDDDIIWWGFSSCLESLDILESEQFLGKNGTRTLFSIECYNGKNVRNHSFFETEGEVLLMPATQLVVVTKESLADNLHIIHLREIEKPQVQLIQPPFPKGSEVQQKTEQIEESVESKSKIEKTQHFAPFEEKSNSSREEGIYADVKELVDQLKANTAYYSLDLSQFENLSVDNAKAIADALKVNTSLTYLYCGRPKKLSRESISYIFEGLKSNRKIDQLTLIGNDVPSCCDLIAEVLRVSEVLKGLWLEEGALKSTNELKVLAEGLKANRSLKVLVLRNNRIDDEGAIFLSEILKVNNILENLHIDCSHYPSSCELNHTDCNQITDRTAQAMAAALRGNRSLTHLGLASGRIGDDGAIALSEMLKVNRSLLVLNLFKNRITDRGAQTFANVLKGNGVFMHLQLSMNQIGDEGAIALGELLKMSNTLRTLDLHKNRITDRGAKALADALQYNSILHELIVSGNNFNMITDEGGRALKAMTNKSRFIR